MTDEGHVSSDEEQSGGLTAAETAALSRKRRLLAMKSKLHGAEMKAEDYEEDAQLTKRAKGDEQKFRSYQPISEVLGDVDTGLGDMDVVEKEIVEHLKDTKEVAPVENIDISTLAPKKVDWDLKRDIEKKLQKLERRTQRSVAEIIRCRLAEGKGDLADTVSHVAGL